MASKSQNYDIDELLSSVNDETFSIEFGDWNHVVMECESLCAQWQQLSIYLGLSKQAIDRIKEDNHSDSKHCWGEALDQWIKQNYSTEKFGLPSWRTLLKAVSKVDKRLFKKLASKYQVINSSTTMPTTRSEKNASNTGTVSDVTSTGMTAGNVAVSSTKKIQLHSQDTSEKALLKQRKCDAPMESSSHAIAKYLLKKQMPEGRDEHEVPHPSVSHTHDQRFLDSMLSVQPSTSDKPTTEQSFARSLLQKCSLATNAESFTQPDCSGYPCTQLYAPGEPVYKEVTNNTTDLGRTDSLITFSLSFDQSKLKVRLINATDLPEEFRKGHPVQCDPFIMLHLEPNREDTFQSKVIRSTRNPIFNQTFQFGGLSAECIKLQTLVLRIYNHTRNNETIGKVRLSLCDAELSGTFMRMKIVHTEEMESNYQGDLLLSLKYNPVSCTLTGTIDKAAGLRKHDIFGKSDPYVKVIVSYYDTIVYKCKTSVKYQTLAPIYNESFSCKIAEDISRDDITISFFVVDYDFISRNDMMGVVNIGKNVDSELGRKHWHQVLQSPRQGISFWHPIQLATTAQKQHM